IILKEELDNGFQPPIERLQEVLSEEKIKAVILISPDNPTGRVIERKTAKALADLAIDHKFLIITDEAYRTLVYEGEHTYIYPLAPEHVVSLNAFSKDPGIPGWRLGFVYGPKEIIKKIKLVVSETVYCPPIIAQELVEIYLSDLEKADQFIKSVRQVYSSKRDLLIKAIQEYIPKGKFVRPKGGMFVFLDLSEYLSDKKIGSEEFAKLLLEKKQVAVVPGSYFSRYYNYSIRLSFVTEENERIVEGVERIGELLSEL
ncbi:MAG: pyridoxal phosphate-dependent aminotransferase, partial [Desulfurococcales archaeon]|nr:pyridoxal phosphate-dependent aminotransferase [Desulfurococcales archaeon]